MDGAVDVSVVVLVVVDERIDHLPRLLRSRSVVQIDKRLAIHLPLQDREILAYALNVERHAAASSRWNRGSASAVRSSRNTRSGSISTLSRTSLANPLISSREAVCSSSPRDRR